MVTPSSSDAFGVFGIPRRFAIDPDELERRFRELSRQHHPDRFATAPAADRVRALRQATALNDAYRTLKVPTARAQHLLALAGMPIGDKDEIPHDFLLEILEKRETLAEARVAADQGTIDSLHREIAERATESLAAVDAAFAAEPPDLGAAKAALLQLRYFDRFLAEAEGRDQD